MIVTPFTHEHIHKTVWDVHPNGNVFPGLTLWDVHKNGNVFLGLTVCDIHTNGNVFPGLTVWDVVGETDPPTPMGTGPLSVRRGAEAAQRADRGSTREQFYPASGRTDA